MLQRYATFHKEIQMSYTVGVNFLLKWSVTYKHEFDESELFLWCL
jgi:hypothetical protein